LFDPMLFTRIILILYAANALQFLIRGNFIGFSYWAGAAVLTVCASIGFQGK
jgi:hypothetical protein